MRLFLVSFLASFSFIIQFCSNKGYRNMFLFRAFIFKRAIVPLNCRQVVVVCFAQIGGFVRSGTQEGLKSFRESSAGGVPRLRLRLWPSPLHQPEQQRPGRKNSSGARKGCYFSALPPLPPPPPPPPPLSRPPRMRRSTADPGGNVRHPLAPLLFRPPVLIRTVTWPHTSGPPPAPNQSTKVLPNPDAFFVRIFPARHQRHLATRSTTPALFCFPDKLGGRMT